jgi:prepilin-type N-terminal cleavage/methylation domain-containing protein
MQPRTMKSSGKAFTLVELLVVIGIIALLVSILMPALSAARRQSQTVRDLAALRTLMTAFHAYAAENRGRVLPGYWPGPAEDDRSQPIGFPANARYPWRLMPYLQGAVKGGILSGEQEALIGERDAADYATWAYTVSVFPSFGMNIHHVGGDLVNGSLDPVTRTGEPSNPSDLIVFASARYNLSGRREGYFEVRRPSPGAQYDEAALAHEFGFVHLRYGPRGGQGRAACALFDGHAALLDEAELKDPRHWQNARHLSSGAPPETAAAR